ncbi:RT0821/Lpp0805 family surface protein [Pararhizobium antarcticum]|uniref:Surface antigen domain-containing protein n=1 Tax=Pararhizobium antarcticum TaxID=1798805 RepID=A0A657LWG7_9HYPH|nr:RT0821/Lpp0805 family surface protein [Pararhizobium antarcticum]OJF98772.1 hypothetical protein AX760_01700 [Pararhizobium antarcticum]OJF98841.1 hypothetical protein AX760_02115 [Pararhizobium antarcticum]
MQDIAKCSDHTKGLSRRRASLATLCLITLCLSGCMSAGLDLADTASVDTSLSTGSVPQSVNRDSLSDEVTVRNAVSSADVETTGGNPIPWANSNSGSAGVISSIEEDRSNGQVCRRFTTTRHSYQGIAKFDGNTCLLGNGEWYLTRFGKRS